MTFRNIYFEFWTHLFVFGPTALTMANSPRAILPLKSCFSWLMNISTRIKKSISTYDFTTIFGCRPLQHWHASWHCESRLGRARSLRRCRGSPLVTTGRFAWAGTDRRRRISTDGQWFSTLPFLDKQISLYRFRNIPTCVTSFGCGNLLASIEFDETFPFQDEKVYFERTFCHQLHYPDVGVFGYQT